MTAVQKTTESVQPTRRTVASSPGAPQRESASSHPVERALLRREPEVRVAHEIHFGPEASAFKKARALFAVVEETAESLRTPGTMVGRFTTRASRAIPRIREQEFTREAAIPHAGLQKLEHGWKAHLIPNPDDPQGRWDPYAYMPNLVFHPKEDSFPILPDFDGDRQLKTDAARYRHGVIGGDQPLRGSFSVARKGEYTVLTYSLYYVDNKSGRYHLTDESTMAVYLKPGRNGKLRPEYIFTSWHYGGNLARWKDIKKGPDGRPIIEIGRGTHALRPMAPREELPQRGLRSDGQGRLSLHGQPLSNRLTWVSPQANVSNAILLEPGRPENRFVLDAYYAHHPERVNPFHPSLFD